MYVSERSTLRLMERFIQTDHACNVNSTTQGRIKRPPRTHTVRMVLFERRCSFGAPSSQKLRDLSTLSPVLFDSGGPIYSEQCH